MFQCKYGFKCTLESSGLQWNYQTVQQVHEVLQRLVGFVILTNLLAFEHLRQAGKHLTTIRNAESNQNTTENIIKVSKEILLLLLVIDGCKITFIYSALGTYSIGCSDTGEEDYLLFIQLLKDAGHCINTLESIIPWKSSQLHVKILPASKLFWTYSSHHKLHLQCSEGLTVSIIPQ